MFYFKFEDDNIYNYSTYNTHILSQYSRIYDVLKRIEQ